MLSYYDSSDPNYNHAVVIAQGRAHDRGHTSSAYCIEISDFGGVDKRIHGKPFRLLNNFRSFLWDNNDLRAKEINIGSIVVVDSLRRFVSHTGMKMGTDEVLAQLQFGSHGAAFRGVAEAFPNAVIPSQGSKGIYQKTTKPDPAYALISVQAGHTIDDRIVVTTRLGEEINLNNRSRAHKPSGIETVPLPLHQPASIDDVGNVILVAFGKKTPQGDYLAICEGILLWTNSGQTENARIVLNPVYSVGGKNLRKHHVPPADEPHGFFITPTDPSKLPAHINHYSDDVYPMTSNPRGIALIINNEVFSPSTEMKKENLEDRYGSENDVVALEKLFKALYFKVIIERNIGGQKILEVLDDVANSDHSAYDCFVLCLMSHGLEGLFYGSDGQTVSFESVCDLFSQANCRTLRGKPKVFLIQACRGQDRQTGVVSDSPFFPTTATPASNADRGWNFSFKGTMPDQSDILMAYSTVNHYVSYRTELGSRFVRCLVEVFQEKAGHEDVVSMLITVNERLSKMGDIGSKQVGQPTMTLTKKLFLWPGLPT